MAKNPVHKFKTLLELIELCFGMIAAFMVAFLAPTLSLLGWLAALLSNGPDAQISAWWPFAAFVGTTAVAWGSVKFLAKAAETSPFNSMPADTLPINWKMLWNAPDGQLPWGVHLGQAVIAARWFVVAPFVVPWFIFYLMSGIPTHLAHRWILAAADNPDTVGGLAIRAAIIFAFSVAMHAYLILAMAGLFRSLKVVWLLWNWRFALDLAVTGTVLVVSAWVA